MGLTLILGSNVHAKTINTRIFELFDSHKEPKTFVESTADRMVYWIPNEQVELRKLLELAQNKGTPIRLKVTTDREIKGVTPLSTEDAEKYTDDLMKANASDAELIEEHLEANSAQEYYPTVLSSYARAQSVFYSQSPLRPRSQCYQRAHVWAHNLYVDQGLKTMKVFLFFTKKYIAEYNYKWWFHVSPFTYYKNDQGLGTEIVLDRTFTDSPLHMKEWTEEFMEPGMTCPTVDTYAEYASNQWSRYCYLRKVPMYYYQPLDVEALDHQGRVLHGFISSQVDQARRKNWARRRNWNRRRRR